MKVKERVDYASPPVPANQQCPAPEVEQPAKLILPAHFYFCIWVQSITELGYYVGASLPR
jgi:hypothetical protein